MYWNVNEAYTTYKLTTITTKPLTLRFSYSFIKDLNINPKRINFKNLVKLPLNILYPFCSNFFCKKIILYQFFIGLIPILFQVRING